MIYFIYGQDSYRSKQKLEEIIEGYKKVHKSGLNLVYIDAEEKDFKDLEGNFRAVSMFSEKKLIVLKNVFENVKFQEDFLENIKKLEETKDIIVVYEGSAPDQRSKFFKALKKLVKCQEFELLQGRALHSWIEKEFEAKNTKIEPQAQDLLLSSVGNNLWQLSREINKLSNYKPKDVVKRSDVELLVRSNIENDIFKTIDALASKDKKQALGLLKKHIESGDSPLYLLSMITYQFRNLLIIKESPKNTGLHPFVVQKSSYMCRQFTTEQLKKIYLKIFQLDSDIKTGRVDPEIALDLLVSEI